VTSIYENHLSRLLGNEKLMALNAHHILAYQRRRKAEKRKTRGVEGTVSNRTIMKELDYFSGFLTWCRREKKLAVPEIRIEPLPYERPIPMVLSPDEVAGIIEAAEPVYKALFLCLYSLGLRLAEARNIRGQDVDMKYNVVRVIQKGGTYKLLPLNDWVRAALKPLIPKEPKAYIFENPRTGEPYINLRKAIDRACKRAGVTKHVTAHLFRHSIATHFLAQDVNLRTIQQYLGHSQVQTTEFYTHVAVGHLRSASDGLFKGVSAGLSTKTPTGSG
jgi:integrase